MVCLSQGVSGGNSRGRGVLLQNARPRQRVLHATTAVALGVAVLAVGCKGLEISGSEPKEERAPAAPAAADESHWCAGHGLPESMCTKCNPSLVERFKEAGDWCAGHGFPESACPSCNPMQPPGAAEHPDWCAEHGRPESKCPDSTPALVERFKETGDWCVEHALPESACPSCNPVQPPPGAASPGGIRPGTRVRLRSPDLSKAAGIETVAATAATMGIGVEAMAHIEFNRNAMADIRSAVPGIVREVSVDLGEEVSKDDALFVLESVRVGDLQARRGASRERVGAARANLRRQQKLRKGNIASQREVELARQELEVAQAELRAIDQSLKLSGASRKGATGRFALRSPMSGVVVRRPAVVGSYAGEPDSLATVADTSTMWALLDVPEWDAVNVGVGQKAEVRVDGVAGRIFTATVTWIASEVDPRTRTVEARAEVPNPDGALRAGQFARASIRVAAPKSAATVPVVAVQQVDDESVVFVHTAPGVYEPRVVRPGRSNGRLVQVAGDVHEGDLVVTTGAFLLRTELSLDSLGKGCGEHH